ncbi:Ig-like domain-containing protein [Paracidobacterium acidisoli]|uniref:Ig-like domain-containing protein n=1 Tax=Paracidobacterium acidisoli TaxID=2303751 RepID=UPI003314C912
MGNGPAPTGTLQFYDGSTPIGAPVPLQQGAGTYTSAAFAVGSHSITAVYSGDSNYPSVTSTPTTFTVIAQGTDTLSLTYTGATTVTMGIPISIPGKIQYSPILGPAPSGAVSLLEDGAAIGSVTLNGSSTFSFSVNSLTSPLTPGTHVFTLSYPGDAHWSSSSASSGTSILIQHATSNLILVLPTAPVSAEVGSPIKIVGALSELGSNPAPNPTGDVQLLDGTIVIASVPLSGFTPGTTSVTVNFSVNTPAAPLSDGMHQLSLNYPGDSIWIGHPSGSLAVTITGNVPKFTLTSNVGAFPNAVHGTPVTFTATAGAVNGLATPTGTVQFYIDGAAAGSPVPMSGGVATCTPSGLSVGSHTATAAYSGNSTYGSVTTNGTVAIVTQGSDALVLTAPSAQTVDAGMPFTLTGTLNVTSFGPAPTGTVTLLDNGTALATTTLSGNPPFALSFPVNTASAPLAGGSNSFTLQYAGGSQWTAATAAAQSVTVNDFSVAPAQTALTVAPGSSATETLNVKYLGSLAATTTFTCSGLPNEASCSFNPASVTGSGSTTLTITTTGATKSELRWLTGGGATTLACLLFFGLPLRSRKWLLLPCALLALFIGGLTGCGGGGNMSGGGGGTGNSGTPAGNYTVTVSAVTSGTTSITHTTTFTLTVQ